MYEYEDASTDKMDKFSARLMDMLKEERGRMFNYHRIITEILQWHRESIVPYNKRIGYEQRRKEEMIYKIKFLLISVKVELMYHTKKTIKLVSHQIKKIMKNIKYQYSKLYSFMVKLWYRKFKKNVTKDVGSIIYYDDGTRSTCRGNVYHENGRDVLVVELEGKYYTFDLDTGRKILGSAGDQTEFIAISMLRYNIRRIAKERRIPSVGKIAPMGKFYK